MCKIKKATADFEYEIFPHIGDTNRIRLLKYVGGDAKAVIPEVFDGMLVSDIRHDAFDHCDFLTSITLDNNNLFYGPVFAAMDGVLFDKELTQIIAFPKGKTGKFTIPDSVKVFSINDIPRYCELTANDSNPYWTIIDGVLFSRDATELLEFPRWRTGEYRIPDGVAFIADEAFYQCRLTKVDLPDGMMEIGKDAFSYCHELRNATIPDSISYIGNNAFCCCIKLDDIRIPTCAWIDDYAFSGCWSLSNLTVPENLGDIGNHAFTECGEIAEEAREKILRKNPIAFAPYG